MKIIHFCIFYLTITSTINASDQASDTFSANKHSEELNRKFDLSTENILAAVRNLNRHIESTNSTPMQIDTAKTAAFISAKSAKNTLDRKFLQSTLIGPKQSSDEQGKPTLVIVQEKNS
jgi:hypothetical protein